MADRPPFADQLRSLLAEHGMSQAELSRRTGIPRSTISKLVNNRAQPNAKVFGLIAYEFDLDLLELMGVASALAERDELRAQREHLFGERDSLRSELALAKGRELALKKRLDERGAVVSDLTKQVRALKKEKQGQAERLKELEGRTQRDTKRLEKSQRELEKNRRELESSRRELGKHRRELESRQREVEKLRKELDNAKKKRPTFEAEPIPKFDRRQSFGGAPPYNPERDIWNARSRAFGAVLEWTFKELAYQNSR